MSFRSDSVPAIDEVDVPAWAVALALALALVAQTTFLHYTQFHGAIIGLVLILTVLVGLRSGTRLGLMFGMIAGACEDALGTSGVAWTFSTGLAGALAGRAGKTLLGGSLWAIAPFVAMLTIVRFAMYLLTLRIEGAPVAQATQTFHAALWQAAMNGLLTVIVVAFARRKLRRRAR